MLLSIIKIGSHYSDDYELCITAIDPELSKQIDNAIGTFLRKEISLKEFKNLMKELLSKVVDQIEESVCIPKGDLDELDLDAEPDDFEYNKLCHVIESFDDIVVKGYLARVEDWQDYIRIRAVVTKAKEDGKVVTTIKWIFEPLDITIVIEKTIEHEVELDTDGAYDPDDDMLL